ncbi:hypothetical protein EVAR_400_1 [Eumeta japonica]|uniref:Uncharacterized protein n=1 Tax=Eumeta variegata TaxID=151549 RepID=A0A4C1SCX8_EUMVA|nr:hypothetical protein EVAR_400_1 [Eumeta japonica]
MDSAHPTTLLRLQAFPRYQAMTIADGTIIKIGKSTSAPSFSRKPINVIYYAIKDTFNYPPRPAPGVSGDISAAI